MNLLNKTTLGLLTVSALAFPMMASANDALAAIMKQAGKDFKALGPQIADGTKNTSSVTLAKDIDSQLTKALAQVPDEVANGNQKIEDYKAAIGDVQKQIESLVAALEKGDNNSAAAILMKISDLKKTAHGTFDPQPPTN